MRKTKDIATKNTLTKDLTAKDIEPVIVSDTALCKRKVLENNPCEKVLTAPTKMAKISETQLTSECKSHKV